MSDLKPPGVTAPPEIETDQLIPEGELATLTLWGDVWRKLKRDKRFWIASITVLIFAAMAIAPWLFFTTDPFACDIHETSQHPSAEHWFGTDLIGCDYYTRVIYGARTSLQIGLLVAGVELAIALFAGSAAGYFGGWVDTVISRFADVWFSVPTILGSILLLTMFQGGGPVVIAVVIALFAWPDMTRLMRAVVISGRQRGYIRAARTMGARGKRVLVRHVLPNGIGPVLVFCAYVVGGAIGAEAGLTFLGVGLRLPAISWGLQLAVADTRFPELAYLMFFPSLFLCLLIGAFILLGEALRDAMDPKLFGTRDV